LIANQYEFLASAFAIRMSNYETFQLSLPRYSLFAIVIIL